MYGPNAKQGQLRPIHCIDDWSRTGQRDSICPIVGAKQDQACRIHFSNVTGAERDGGSPTLRKLGAMNGSAGGPHLRQKRHWKGGPLRITATDRIHLVLLGTQNRTSGPYLAAMHRILIPSDGKHALRNAARYSRSCDAGWLRCRGGGCGSPTQRIASSWSGGGGDPAAGSLLAHCVSACPAVSATTASAREPPLHVTTESATPAPRRACKRARGLPTRRDRQTHRWARPSHRQLEQVSANTYPGLPSSPHHHRNHHPDAQRLSFNASMRTARSEGTCWMTAPGGRWRVTCNAGDGKARD
jgi:hypothetical protein